MSAKSRGEIKAVFQRSVSELQLTAASAASPLEAGGVDDWPVLGEWNGEVDDAAGLTKPFDRAEIGQLYEQCLYDSSAPGTTGDAIALQIQNDYVAAREMAFRDALASPVRRAMAAMARRLGHAESSGIFGNGILRYVQEVMRQGGRT